MLQCVKDLEGWVIQASNGAIGRVAQFYFDDQEWVIRYLVAETGGWLIGRKVLISPIALAGFDADHRSLLVDLTTQQIENSPPLATAKPVSRQYEVDYFRYYGWPFYWSGPALWGGYANPTLIPPMSRSETLARGEPIQQEEPNPHLRSTKEVTGYAIRVRDGEIGHVEDFILDEESWSIRYLGVDTKNWWPGKKVLVPPSLCERIDWVAQTLTLQLFRSQIRNAPEWDEGTPITTDYVEKLDHYYGPWYHRGEAGLLRGAA